MPDVCAFLYVSPVQFLPFRQKPSAESTDLWVNNITDSKNPGCPELVNLK
jgi:hypothetical protein